MKRLVCLVCGCVLLVSSFAQNLKISTDKTTSLIFPFPVVHVDRGTKDVLVQQVKEKDNILLVKAACREFTETNLSVVTDDGSVYSFAVDYDARPSQSIWRIPELKEVSPDTYCKSILDNPKIVHGIRDHNGDVYAQITGIYIEDNTIYYQLCLDNESTIDYGIGLLKFYIRDKKKGKRTAVQENELKPVCMVGNIRVIKARTKDMIVAAFDKFTIPDRKYFDIQIMEKNGGRNLNLKVGNKKIVKALPLPAVR